MINIRTERTKRAQIEHEIGLKDQILPRIDKRLRAGQNSLPPFEYNLLKRFIESNKIKILSSEKNELLRLHHELNALIPNFTDLKSDLEYVMKFDWFRSFRKTIYNGFDLANNLKIEVCPYCNKNYTNTFRMDSISKNIFPSFDHFLPKASFPLLTLSFFNLIPTCNVCNTIKSDNDPTTINLFYP